jgi:deoxycytidylate deaminase
MSISTPTSVGISIVGSKRTVDTVVADEGDVKVPEVFCSPSGARATPKLGHVGCGKVCKRDDVIQWDDYFMAIAFLSAMRSKDPSTQVGACIVNPDKRIVGMGYNGFPRGCSDDELPWCRHAEHELDTKYPVRQLRHPSRHAPCCPVYTLSYISPKVCMPRRGERHPQQEYC